MNYLEKFETYYPIDDEVDVALKFLREKYKVNSHRFLNKEIKYISVDDKMVAISGPLKNKGRAVDKIYWDVKDKLSVSEPSLRRAIKDFIDSVGAI